MATSLEDSRVLIVDDNAFNRKTLAMVIARAGINRVEFAADGAEGMEKVAQFDPDLILLDVEMPVMNGLEMCRRLRAIPRYQELPILFQTVFDGDEEQVRCFEAGGSDFISKPIRPGECVARVRHQLEKRILIDSLTTFRHRVNGELMHARNMQMSLLPEPHVLELVREVYGIAITAHFETSSELGGDFWQIYPIDENRVAIFIVDFSGHGITAAINTFRLHTLANKIAADRSRPAEWLAALGSSLNEVLPVGQFATAFYAVIDVVSGQMTFSGAGAPLPVLIDDQPPRPIDSSGLVLGIMRAVSYEEKTVALPEGAHLFLYSDALVEIPDDRGKVLGMDSMVGLAGQALRTVPDAPLSAILDTFFTGRERPLQDDLTAVWLKRLPRPAR